MSKIEIKSLTKRYGHVTALGNVSLTVEDGEFLTILGPSGSGKTTLLLAIAGFEPPTSGSISFDDRDVTDLPAHKRKVGLMFQSYALFPHMSVYKNIEFPLRVRSMPKTDARALVDEALRKVQLENHGDRRPSQLSGGQQQRVALARAFVFKPDTLLLDEPLAALDRKLRQTVQVELKELQKSLGITTIAVTHDQEEALTLSDRIVVLHEGHVHQHGAPRDVYNRPQTQFVANFLGTANTFEGNVNVEGDARSMQCEGIPGRIPVSRESPDGLQTIMVRPEHIRFLPTTDEQGIGGCVLTSICIGPAVRYRIEIEGGRILEVLGPNDRDVAIGERVRIFWDPVNVWVFPDK